MNRAELVDHIAGELNVPKTLADSFISSFTNAVFENVRKDGVKLTGFGRFGSAKRKARNGRNPQTGDEIKIPARWVPTFKAGNSFREAAEKGSKKK